MNMAAKLRTLMARPYGKVTAAQAAALTDRDAILLDVRESGEWRAGHAPKARHIPLAQLPQRQRELPAGRPVVTVCRSGHRSARAAALLAREGRDVSNLAGGMRAWARAGLAVVAADGRAARIA
jgi:rhodanese-related sulfurtransferase